MSEFDTRLALSRQVAAIAVACAQEAGAYVHAHFGAPLLAEDKEGYFDIVTVHDKAAEEMIVSRILRAYPDSRIIGEEGTELGDGPIEWFIDPIDGTSNFASGLPFYCVSIGVVVDGVPVAGIVFDPERDELFVATLEGATLNGQPIRVASVSAESDALCLVGWPYEGRSSGLDEDAIARDVLDGFRAVRRLGSAALSLAYVAAGRAHLASELIAKPWDVAAGFMLVEQAGGTVVRAPSSSDECVSDGSWFAARYVAHGQGFTVEESAMAPVVAVS